MWLGIIVAGVAAVLFGDSPACMRGRGIGVRGKGRRASPAPGGRQAMPAGRARQAAARKRDDDIEDMDDIEAILKKHGI